MFLSFVKCITIGHMRCQYWIHFLKPFSGLCRWSCLSFPIVSPWNIFSGLRPLSNSLILLSFKPKLQHNCVGQRYIRSQIRLKLDEAATHGTKPHPFYRDYLGWWVTVWDWLLNMRVQWTVEKHKWQTPRTYTPTNQKKENQNGYTEIYWIGLQLDRDRCCDPSQSFLSSWFLSSQTGGLVPCQCISTK